MSLSEPELVERAGSSATTVRRLVDLGILVPGGGPAPFEPADVHRVRLMEAFEAGGLDLRVIAAGIEAGEISYDNLGRFLPDPPAFAQSYAELAGESGRPPELVSRLVGEFGLPQQPVASKLRTDDAAVLAELLAVWAEADDEELARLARVYGENLRRLVVSELQLANAALFSRIRRRDAEEIRRRGPEVADGVDRSERTAPHLAPPPPPRARDRLVHRPDHRGLPAGTGPRPRAAASTSAIAFLDLTGYTALTEEQGDEAAAEVAGRLASLVHRAAQAHGGHPVKWLGDGVMFYFPEPGSAVLSALELVEETPAAIEGRARVGVNAGQVISREGDYFGRTVNVAARIADYARPDEVLVSDEVKKRSELAEVDFQPVGPVVLKGVKEELTLYAATRRGPSADGTAQLGGNRRFERPRRRVDELLERLAVSLDPDEAEPALDLAA